MFFAIALITFAVSTSNHSMSEYPQACLKVVELAVMMNSKTM